MTIAFFAIIVVGFVGGIYVGHLGAKAIGRMFGRRMSNHQIVERFALGGSAAVVPIVAVLAFLGGGNIGGGAGAYVSESVGAGSIGAPFGIALGIALVSAVGLTVGAALGGGIGYIVALALGKRGAG
jgi:hypothetical protein